MKSYKISQLVPYLDNLERENLNKVLDNKWLTEGPYSQKFIEMIKEFTGAKYALLANNGTLGLYLSMLTLDIKKGDEVIVPNLTYNATASTVTFVGAKPVFAEINCSHENKICNKNCDNLLCNSSDLQINTHEIESLITQNTKAIVPVHLYGQACDMDKIISVSKKYNLKIIEDAAQGFGVFYDKKHTGTIGDIGVISFFADKTITTGEGAVILTNSEDIYSKMKLIRNQGRENSGTFIHPSLGMNFRMTDLQCAIGVAQIEKFNFIKEKKLENYSLYEKYLSDVPEVKFLEKSKNSNFIPFRASILVENAEKLMKYMEDSLIQTRGFFFPLHRQPCFSYLGYSEDSFPISNLAHNKGVCLPVHLNLKKEDIKFVCDKIKSFYDKKY